jgi:hypothetical protein
MVLAVSQRIALCAAISVWTNHRTRITNVKSDMAKKRSLQKRKGREEENQQRSSTLSTYDPTLTLALSHERQK